MRDDDEGGFGRRDEPLEALEPVEVEIVRRLVEQEHVVAREEDRGQREPRGLAARELLHRPVEPDGQPELGEHRGRARLEIAASECEKAVERGRVALARVAPGSELLGCAGQLEVCRRDAGPAREERSDRLARREHVLLRQIAGSQRRRLADDRAAVRLLETAEDPEQRRLAGAVASDEPEPRARIDLQADAVENDVGTVLTHDIDELKTHSNLRPETAAPSSSRRRRAGNVDGVSVGHGAAFRTPPGT